MDTEALRLGNAALNDICSRVKISIGLSVWGNRGPTTVRFEHPAGHVWDELKAGRVVSLVRSATGLVFLSYLPRNVTRAMLDEELDAGMAGDSAAMTPEDVERSIAEVRQGGMARLFVHRLVQGQEVEFAGFSAPVFDKAGAIVLGLTAIAPTATIDVEWSGPVPMALKAEATLLSRRLGCVLPMASLPAETVVTGAVNLERRQV